MAEDGPIAGMNVQAGSDSGTGGALRLMQLACLVLVAIKAAHLALAGVFMDEAYYWMWGQHPALSYYDHPPLNAWLLALSSALLGPGLPGLRLPVALTFVADIAAFYFISRRIAGNGWPAHFWPTLLLFLTMPVFTMVSNYALPDHVLVATALWAIYFFFRFFQDRAAGAAGQDRDLMLGALFLGLAGLSKYNAAFLGLGIVLYVLWRDRALLGQWRLWLAGTLALALQGPVVMWNLTQRFASWNYILDDRHQGVGTLFGGVLPFFLALLIVVSPFVLWPMLRFAIARSAAPGLGFARASFVLSTLSIVGLSGVTLTLFHWNILAYLAAVPFLALYMRPRWLLALQGLWGGALAAALFVNYAIMPITDVAGWRDQATAWSYGWPDVAQAVAAARSEHGAGFVAAADYTTASLLGFAMGDADVVSLAARRDQFDYWFDAAAHAGQDAILYGDSWKPIPEAIRRQFDTVAEIARFEVAAGRPLNTQIVYLARGFRPGS